ncbi:MAG: DUF3667 domain-containing protein [Cyclobacteriaceae bacterium]|nr:DUF3667 domain-containing protein [Cyclobacteriaceae bacterium]
MTTCKNCGHTFEGKYCNQCRQEATTTRITWSEVVRQLRHATVDVDRGFFFTVQQLFRQPGVMIREYLEGKRVNYSNPFFYVLLMAGFTSLLFLSFDVPLPVRSISLEHIEKMSPLVAQKYFILVGLVVMGMLTGGDLLLHRRAGFNVAEITVASAFQAGQLLVITVMLFPIIYLQDHYFPPANSWLDVRQLLKLGVFVYLVVVRKQLYAVDGRPPALQLIRILAQIIITIAFYEVVVARLIMKMI